VAWVTGLKLTLNDLSAIDAALIKERLREQQTFTITWGDRVRQSFRAAESTLYAIELGQIIEIERTACHFGGERFWFRCPYCDSRRRKPYLSHCGMECRGCPVVSACPDGTVPDRALVLWEERADHAGHLYSPGAVPAEIGENEG